MLNPMNEGHGYRSVSKAGIASMAATLCLAGEALAVPVAHWSFDEIAGTSIADTYRPGQPATLTSVQPGTSLANAAVFNTGVTLTNGIDYVAVPRIDIHQTSFSVAGWVNPASLANGDEIFGDWSNPWQMRLFLNANGSVQATLRRDGPAANNGDLVNATSAASLVAVNDWTHVAMTWNRDQKTLGLFVDGKHVATTTTALANVDLKNGNHVEYQIGWKRDDGNRYDGSLDEIWVFNEALNVAQVQALMTQNTATATKIVDLADIVGGGNGSLPGTGTATGINAANGAVGHNGAGGDNNPAVAGQYSTVSYAAVDGVFVPNGNVGPQVIDSAGNTFNFSGSADGASSYSSWFNGVGGISNPSSQAGLPNFAGDPQFHSLLSAHAQKGITFDLEAIEAAHVGYEINRFTTTVGESRGQTSTSANIDYYVFIDGVLVASGFDLRDTEHFLDLAIAFDAKFLTLVTTNSASNGNNSDHAFFGDPFLHLIAIPEPASMALGLIGLSALALRRRRLA